MTGSSSVELGTALDIAFAEMLCSNNEALFAAFALDTNSCLSASRAGSSKSRPGTKPAASFSHNICFAANSAQHRLWSYRTGMPLAGPRRPKLRRCSMVNPAWPAMPRKKSHTALSHTSLSHRLALHTQLCHIHLDHIQLYPIQQNFVTHTHNFVPNNTTLSHTHTQSFTNSFVANHLSHTALSETALSCTHTQLVQHTVLHHTTLSHATFHIQLCHTQSFPTPLTHRQSFTHNLVTYNF